MSRYVLALLAVALVAAAGGRDGSAADPCAAAQDRVAEARAAARPARVVAALERAVAACAPLPDADAPRRLLPFYPQAGILGRDLYVNNYVDLDPGAGILDWTCGRETYDTHTGYDSDIRSFREQRIGVPVFAALDGEVVTVQRYASDESWGRYTRPFDNHVVVDHGASQETVYGHLRRDGISVEVGDRVRAGQQIGFTASSGNSSGPHLHFTVRHRGWPYEPSVGPCNAGESGWAEQPPAVTAPYVTDVTLSPRPFAGRAAYPWDDAVRTGTFVRGARDVHVRVTLRHADGGVRERLVVRRPDGSVALETAATAVPGYGGAVLHRLRLALALTGRWTIEYDLDGRRAAEAPFDVVAGARGVRNRPPARVTPLLAPAAPRHDEAVFCRLDASLVNEDPDYDVVRYRYRWTVGRFVVRDVVSAALSDALPARSARPGETIGCTVRPSDGRAAGPAASVVAVAG